MIARLDDAARALGERARAATVSVRSASGSGSGIRLGADLVVTCAHCLHEPRASVDVDGRTYAAELERYDAAADVAVLKLATTLAHGAMPELPRRDAATLRPGELVFAFGHPLGARDVLAHGVVRRASERTIVSDVPLAPGNSGGPLFDAAGRLVGMNSAIAGDRSFSVATETIDHVRRAGSEGRLGVTLAPARVRRASAAPANVLVVTAVEAGSDADRSGLALGDAIAAIDGVPLDAATAAVRLRRARALTILQGGRSREIVLERGVRTGAAAA